MVATASTGYWPAADSADSMMASAPSNTAVATSDTSARVGTGAVIIDSSIWVATTTGLPARRAARVICFWMPGTASSGISTPRSPRATISASDSSMISASRSTACGFSILASSAARPRAILRTSARSSGRWMKDSATQSTPVASTASRSRAVLFGQRADRQLGVGQADALLVGDLVAGNDRADDRACRRAASALSCSLPSSISRRWPGSTDCRISGWGRWTRLAVAGLVDCRRG